ERDLARAGQEGQWLTTALPARGVGGALCYGWIDGQAASLDSKRWRQRFTPRRPRSKWSQINCAAVERLQAEGRLAPAGLREMQAAKRDGRWEAAYASPRTMLMPEDLRAALLEHPRARRAFAPPASPNP